MTTPAIKPTLWIMDDDPALRLILEDNFIDNDMTVVAFSNAHGAWTKLIEIKQKMADVANIKAYSSDLPDVIMTDIRMPMMDGLSFSDWLSKETAFAHIPVIVITAHSDLQSAIDSYETGAFEYLPKPFDLDEAVSVVRKAVQRNPYYQEKITKLVQEKKINGTVNSTRLDSTLATHTERLNKKPSKEIATKRNLTTENNVKSISKVFNHQKEASQKVNHSTITSSHSVPLELTDNDNNYGIIGQSVAMQKVFKAIGKLAKSPITVLITGESGTGKELVANALHQSSYRAKKPFIALNMSAIPHDLIESELFGHEKGAFTGAVNTRKGRFEQANGGTLFLDEIGDMPYNTQTRLLRVLSSGEFFRVGGKDPIKVDVRIVSATHQNLEQLVRQNQFREDLFYRLNVIRLPLPPLRERKDDISELITHFLIQVAQELNTNIKTVDNDAMQALLSYDWYGNIRQLENACRWITVMSTGNTIYTEDLPTEILTFLQENPISNRLTTRPMTLQNQTKIHSLHPDFEKRNTSPLHNTTLSTSNIDGYQDTLSTHNTHNISNRQWQDSLYEIIYNDVKLGKLNILDTHLPTFELILMDVVLTHTKGHRGEAAEILGWGRNTLTRKIKQTKLDDKW